MSTQVFFNVVAEVGIWAGKRKWTRDPKLRPRWFCPEPRTDGCRIRIEVRPAPVELIISAKRPLTTIEHAARAKQGLPRLIGTWEPEFRTTDVDSIEKTLNREVKKLTV